MRSIVLAAFLLGAGVVATGCTATVASDPYPPDLVYAAPGVQVIADYNEPIFYSDGYYWRTSGGVLVPVVVLHGRLGVRAPARRRDAHRSTARLRALPAAWLCRPFAGRRTRARVRLAGHADDAGLPRRTAGGGLPRFTSGVRLSRRASVVRLPRRTSARGGPQTASRLFGATRRAARRAARAWGALPRRRLARRPALT